MKRCVQIGFDSGDGYDYVEIPSDKIPGRNNAGYDVPWLFTSDKGRGN